MSQTTIPTASEPVPRQICDELLNRQRFLLTSHARPDGDSIGSQLALAFALERLGKQVRIVNVDAAPEHYLDFPGMDRIEIADSVPAALDIDAVVVMECSDLSRTGVSGLEGHFIINIDHHGGNRMYGALNWFDETAAACGEMVFDIIRGLDVPLTLEIATHIYLAILTDTGSFHHSNITPRTFDICRQTAEAGVNPAAMARRVFDSNSFGKLKLIGALLDSMELIDEGRLAVLYLDDAMLAACGCTHNDTEGVINLPLTAREIQAVVFFRVSSDGSLRVSMRSKYDVDVRLVATAFGGGGHKNAAGFTAALQASRESAIRARWIRSRPACCRSSSVGPRGSPSFSAWTRRNTNRGFASAPPRQATTRICASSPIRRRTFPC
jgi:phosphoesterase RecJ-like protein